MPHASLPYLGDTYGLVTRPEPYPLSPDLYWRDAPYNADADHLAATDFHLHLTGTVLERHGGRDLAARTAAAQQVARRAVTCWRYADERQALSAFYDAGLLRVQWLEAQQMRERADASARLAARRSVVGAVIALASHARGRLAEQERSRPARRLALRGFLQRFCDGARQSGQASRQLRADLGRSAALRARHAACRLRAALHDLHHSTRQRCVAGHVLAAADAKCSVSMQRRAWEAVKGVAVDAMRTRSARSHARRADLLLFWTVLRSAMRRRLALATTERWGAVQKREREVGGCFHTWRDPIMRHQTAARMAVMYCAALELARVSSAYRSWRRETSRVMRRHTLHGAWVRDGVRRAAQLAWRRWSGRAASRVWWLAAEGAADGHRTQRALAKLASHSSARRSLHGKMRSVANAVHFRLSSSAPALAGPTVYLAPRARVQTPSTRASADGVGMVMGCEGSATVLAPTRVQTPSTAAEADGTGMVTGRAESATLLANIRVQTPSTAAETNDMATGRAGLAAHLAPIRVQTPSTAAPTIGAERDLQLLGTPTPHPRYYFEDQSPLAASRSAPLHPQHAQTRDRNKRESAKHAVSGVVKDRVAHVHVVGPLLSPGHGVGQGHCCVSLCGGEGGCVGGCRDRTERESAVHAVSGVGALWDCVPLVCGGEGGCAGAAVAASATSTAPVSTASFAVAIAFAGSGVACVTSSSSTIASTVPWLCAVAAARRSSKPAEGGGGG